MQTDTARQLEATTKAYIEKFVSKKGIVAKDYQSAYIMALKFVLPEGELRELVKKNFAANIRKKVSRQDSLQRNIWFHF